MAAPGEPGRAARRLWRRLRGRAQEAPGIAAARRGLLIDPGDDLIDALWRDREALAAWLEGEDGASGPAGRAMIADLAGLAVRWLEGRNQFLQADPALAAALREAYAEGAAGLAALLREGRGKAAFSQGVRALFAAHHDRLGRLLKAAFGPRLKDAVWSTYSADLQRRVLRLEGELPGPILDVGCGAEGRLTLALRAEGREVVGFDRQAEATGLIRADWLAYDYGAARWGLVVSHLGFSLHFLHQHLAGSAQALDYARTYRRILDGLKPGGVFAYAPALPFIEDVLPAGFVVDRYRWDVAEPAKTACWVFRR